MPQYLRAFRADDQSADDGPLRFVASTEGVKRDGQDLSLNQWDLTNYKRNNLFLWAHSYGSIFGGAPLLPIGRAEVTVDEKNKRLLADVTFDPDDEFAQTVRRKYTNKFLNAVSVGWDVVLPPGKSFHEVTKDEIRLDLLDVSAVPIPGDPDALMERQKRALADYGRELLSLVEPENDDPPNPETREHTPPQHRGAIPPHTTEKLPEDAAWDGPGEVAKAEGKAQLRRMHTWVDDEGDAETKRAYKLPHHTADGQAVWRGVAAAMARLLQAGTQIPDADRRGCHAHLSRHYRQFDRTPPEFRTNEELDAYSPTEIRGLFLEGEPELFPDLFAEHGERAGKAINARNRERLEQAASLIAEVLNSVKKQADDEEERTVTEIVTSLDDLFAGATP